jgi:hypothetical protein
MSRIYMASGGQCQNPVPEPHSFYKLELELAVSSGIYLPVLYWEKNGFLVYTGTHP